MRQYFRLAAVLVLVSLCWVCCAQAKEAAANFTLLDLNRNAYTLSNYKGKKPVVLFFWTTWCHYCLGELKLINDFWMQMEKDGFEFFAINVGEPSYKVENFAENYLFTFKILLDRDGKVFDGYGLIGVPTYILVDKEGNVVFKNNYFPLGKYNNLLENKRIQR